MCASISLAEADNKFFVESQRLWLDKLSCYCSVQRTVKSIIILTNNEKGFFLAKTVINPLIQIDHRTEPTLHLKNQLPSFVQLQNVD